MEDTKKELERLQKALLADETMVIKGLDEDLTEDLPEDLTEGMDNAMTAQLLEEFAQEEPVQEAQPEEALLEVDDAMLEELMAEVSSPAFDDPDAMPVSDETMVFCNYSNDYGKELAEYGENEAVEEQVDQETKKRDDKIVIGLMITASALCLGIIGVLAYWLVTFL